MLNSILHRPNFPVIVSAYTISSHLGNYYQRASIRLTKSLIKYNLRHFIYPLNPVNDWVKGCSLKPTVILSVLKTVQCPVLWIDADAELFAYPELFNGPTKFDMALRSSEGHWLSGTLYFTPKAIDFVEHWLSQTKPNEPDEITLLRLYRNCPPQKRPVLEMLPQSYNTVVHSETDFSQVVIGHHVRPDVAPSRGFKPNIPDQI